MGLILKENDIRPVDLLEEQERLFLLDVKQMMDRKNEFQSATCPACESNLHKPAITKYQMQFVRCDGCSTLYANPRPTRAIVEQYYLNSQNYTFWAKNIFPRTEAIRRSNIFAPRVDALLKKCAELNVNTGTLLEIGPGFGTFCEEVRERNVFNEIIAVEPTPELAESLRVKNFKVSETFIEAFSDEDCADVITAFEVIEHMLNPRFFLEIIFRALRPGGIVYLSCPNGEGFDTKVLQEHSPAVDVEHLTLFNPYSLEKLLGSVGFTKVITETPGVLDTDIVKNRLDKDRALAEKHSFISMLVNDPQKSRNFQQFLRENKLSGNLVGIAQKPF